MKNPWIDDLEEASDYESEEEWSDDRHRSKINFGPPRKIQITNFLFQFELSLKFMKNSRVKSVEIIF